VQERDAGAPLQDALQHLGAHVRSEPHLRPAGDHRPEVPRSPAAGGLRSVRVSNILAPD